MAKQHEHLDWAKENEAFAETLDHSKRIHRCWAITALFYAAVHYVDAYFVARGNRPIIHKQRQRQIEDSVHLRSIYEPYRELQSMSEEARYQLAHYSSEDFDRAKRLLNRIREAVLPNVR